MLVIDAEERGFNVRIVSFNIRYDEPNDGDHVWLRRLPVLASVWRHMNADIVGIQEGLPHQVGTISALFPEYAWVGRGGNPDASGEHEAIYFRRDRFQCLESGTFWLSRTPYVPGGKSFDNSGIRTATWARLWDLENGAAWFVVNAHFDVRSEFSRIESSAQILSFIERSASLDTDPVVVLGDLNAEPESEPMQRFTRDGRFVDALAAAGDTRQTYHGFTGRGSERIDYVLCSRRVSVAGGFVNTDSIAGIYPSDHFPVVADLELARAAST